MFAGHGLKKFQGGYVYWIEEVEVYISGGQEISGVNIGVKRQQKDRPNGDQTCN